MGDKSILSVLMFVAAIVWLGWLSTPMALGVTDKVTAGQIGVATQGTATSTGMLPASQSVDPCIGASSKWALWSGGACLRGANIWQDVNVPLFGGIIGNDPLGPPYTQADLNALSAMGANVVRIHHPGLYSETAPYALNADAQANLDNLLTMIQNANMFAYIAFNSGPGLNEAEIGGPRERHSVWTSQAEQDAWVAMWKYTAGRYKNNPIVVGYDLMNEPIPNLLTPTPTDVPSEFYPAYANTLYDWNPLAKRITAAIREVDATTPILIPAMNWSYASWLGSLTSNGDSKSVYMVHQYEPSTYTMQPAPYTNTYGTSSGTFTRNDLLTQFAYISNFKAARNVPVGIGEFGLHRFEPGAAQFLDDEMSIMESNGLNYSIWHWDPSYPLGSLDWYDFDYRKGTDPNNNVDVVPNALTTVIQKYFSKNTVRPSNTGIVTVTQTGANNCAASVSSSLVAHIPIVTYSGANYWADLQYNSANSTLTLTNAGIVSDVSSYSNCTPSSLTSDLKLHIPVVILNGLSYWVDLQYSNSVFAVTGSGANSSTATAPGRWIMGYYAGYQRDMYPVSAIDWSGVTHIAAAFYLPKSNGTLDETLFLDATNGPALARSLVTAAHQNNRKGIASVGGSDVDCSSLAANQLTCGMHSRWVSAASDSTRATFVTNLKKLITDYGYDGLDLDWEPIQASDAAAVKALVAALRTALPTTTLTMPVGYTTVSASEDMSLYSQLAGQMDQINLMTYGMAGAYSGWKSWHSSALYQQDSATPTSVESSVKAYLKAGVPAAKLGVGVGFYGLCYTLPVTAPLQTLGASSIAADDSTMTYAQIMTTYYSSSAYHYDSTAKVPYLSFASATGTAGCSYITYEDEQSIADKGAYVKAQGLGGAIVWTLNQGYYNSQSPLLTALRNAILQ